MDWEVEGVMRRQGGVRGHLPRLDDREVEELWEGKKELEDICHGWMTGR